MILRTDPVEAMVSLAHGRTVLPPIKIKDPHGIFVGKEYSLNLTGKTLTWCVIAVQPLEEN